MRNFQDTFETRNRSVISAFSVCMTVPLKKGRDMEHFSTIAVTHFHRLKVCPSRATTSCSPGKKSSI